MKLIDALRNAASKSSTLPANLEELHGLFFEEPIDSYDYKGFERLIRQVPVYEWMCADTTVGLRAIVSANGAVLGWRWQDGRKNPEEYRFLTRESAEYVKKVVLQCVTHRDPIGDLVASEEELEQELPAEWEADLAAKAAE
jgi:hypothetical protein